MSAREAEKKVSLEFEKKVAALQEVIQENNLSLDACMKEIDELSKKLEEKSKECNFLRVQNERLEEFHSDVQPYKNDLNNIFEPQEYSIGKNAKTTHETSAAVQRLEDLKNQVNKLQNEVREKEESLKRVKSESLQKELEKDNIIKTLEQRLEKAQVDLEVKHDQYLEQKRQKESAEEFNKKIKEEMQSVEATRAQSFKDTDALNSKVNDLESQVKMKKCEISDLKNENQKKEAQICKLESKIEKLKCEIDQVRLNSSKIDELLEKSVCREDSLKSEICRLKKEAECYEKRIKKLEETIKHLEDQLYALQSSSSLDDGCRSQEFNEQVQCLLSTIKAKDIEIENHVAQEKQLCFQITRMESCIKDRERQMSQMSETLKKMSCELRNRSAEMEKLEEQNTQNQQQQIKSGPDTRSIICPGCNFAGGDSEVTKLTSKHRVDFTPPVCTKSNFKAADVELTQLKAKLKDMQEALTAEIADKHDEIRRLKDDVKELEDKLLQSDKQTQFRDDIIKELRKEVKMGRAKESLAEMLGLKGTPRAVMKNRIENLTGQMEEMRTHILSLEARLAECNLPAVLSLRTRLNKAEGSLIALCNKMDYVRRYLENLKGDEEMSMKCGLEALLNELRDDVEWNRQMRRNLSLDEGTSVIVISHRSRSLPDNSLHRIPAKTQSESAVVAAANKQLGTNFHHSLETFQECKNYIHAINELECDFDETDKAILDTWNSFKLWSQSSGDYVLKEFGSLVKLCVEDNEVLAKLATQVRKAVDEKVDLNNGCNLSYLEGNLIELGRYLTKANLATPASDSDLNKNVETDEKGMLSKKISDVISDSLSLIYGMKRNNQTQVSPKVRSCLEDLMVSFSPILGSKKIFLEKLVSLQQQEVEFVQSFLARVNEFDTGLSAYHNIAENLKNEIRKLFSVLLTKENQIQKQYDEIHNLKALLSSNDRSEHTVDEISNLRKVVSNKDLQLIEKEELIHNLRSLNYTLRRTKLSKSSPSICCSGDLGETLEDRMQQLEDCVLNIKGSLSSILTYLMRCQEKMSVFEEESRNLVHVLAQTHQEITSYKEAVLDGKGDIVNISSLNECLSDAASKVEHLLNAAEIFLCDSEKPDLNFTSEALRRKLMKLVFVVEFIKKNALQEHALIKAIIEENEELKKKVRALEDQIAEEKCLDISGSDKDDLILSLRDSLRKAQADLEAVHEEYSNLKIQKEDMELRNQKVMEELQAKISTLQESALRNQSSDSECLLQLQRTSENQIQKLKQLEKREEALKNALLIKEQELHLSKKECKDLMNMLNRLRTENINLQSQVNDARLLIRTIQYNFEEKKTENDNLKMQLEEIGNLTELQSMEVDKLQEELLSTTLKYDEVKIAEAMISENYNKLKEEFQVFQEERTNMEKKIFLLQDELTKKTEEITHRQYVLEKQKDNLTKYLEENQTLKMQHEEDEKIRVKLEYELEKLQEDLKVIQDRGRVIAGELVEKKQAIYQLNLEKAKQTSYIRDLETLLKERSRTQYSPDEKGDTNKDIVEEQEEIIEFLTLRIHQMSQYIVERDETIKLIEGQLKASTELMEDDTDPEERRRTNPFSRQTNIDSQRLSAYKVKLQQAMQQNWRLVNMVDRLQSINYTLLSDKTSSSKISRLDIFNDAG